MNDLQNVLDIRNCAALAQRANGEPVTAVAITVAEVDVSCWTADS